MIVGVSVQCVYVGAGVSVEPKFVTLIFFVYLSPCFKFLFASSVICLVVPSVAVIVTVMSRWPGKMKAVAVKSVPALVAFIAIVPRSAAICENVPVFRSKVARSGWSFKATFTPVSCLLSADLIVNSTRTNWWRKFKRTMFDDWLKPFASFA